MSICLLMHTRWIVNQQGVDIKVHTSTSAISFLIILYIVSTEEDSIAYFVYAENFEWSSPAFHMKFHDLRVHANFSEQEATLHGSCSHRFAHWFHKQSRFMLLLNIPATITFKISSNSSCLGYNMRAKGIYIIVSAPGTTIIQFPCKLDLASLSSS